MTLTNREGYTIKVSADVGARGGARLRPPAAPEGLSRVQRAGPAVAGALRHPAPGGAVGRRQSAHGSRRAGDGGWEACAGVGPQGGERHGGAGDREVRI